MIFATFFGCCLSGALLAGALGTPRWTEAAATRAPTASSQGRLHFGLFHGTKDLNVAYGWRTQHFSGKKIFNMLFIIYFMKANYHNLIIILDLFI